MKKPKSQIRIKKHDPRSEAAQREVCKMILQGDDIYWDRRDTLLYAYHSHTANLFGKPPTAIFDLRDCFRKRLPLKGIKKAFNKAIAPKRQKGK